MAEKKIRNEEGTCPKCGYSDGLNYDTQNPERDDAALGYNWTCPSCKATGTEWYNLEFSHHEVKENSVK